MARGLRQGDRQPRPVRPPLTGSRLHTLRFGLLALAALIAVRFPLPWMGVAIACVVGADVEGIRAARAFKREAAKPSFLVWTISGLVLLSLLGLGVVSTVALYPITHQRQECLTGANTQVARAACQSEYDRRVGGLDLRLIR